jgi:hypothetical protein
MFDPELFGQAMGEAINKAVAPLHAKIADLEKQLAERPDVPALVSAEVSKAVAAIPAAKDGKDCDMAAVKALVDQAVKAIPAPKDGKDADPEEIAKMVKAAVDALPKPQDGKSVTMADVQPVIADAVKAIRDEAMERVDLAVKAIPIPKDGRDGVDGKDGSPGEKGSDGAGIADLLTDREGALIATFTDGRMKNLGIIVGKDGRDGVDGKDGIGLEAFELEYLPETHEVAIKASCAGRVKELRYPAGGIRPAGYWRDGTSAKAGEAWVHDGSLWIATKDTQSKPETKGADWIIAARRGRDGERGQKGQDGAPPAPIKLKD